jgi:hypothetical protein
VKMKCYKKKEKGQRFVKRCFLYTCVRNKTKSTHSHPVETLVGSDRSENSILEQSSDDLEKSGTAKLFGIQIQ